MKGTEEIIATDAVVDELMTDWLERDGETFTHIRKKGRLGWESTLEKDESYSAYFLEAPTQADLVKRAYSLAKDMIVVMDPPFKVSVHIGGKTSATTGKVVNVSTEVFDEKELSVGEKLDTFLGLVIHEGCHLLYTDLSWLGKFTIAAIHNIWNIIEDERIERLCGDLKPGLANFLEKSKYYYFDHHYLDALEEFKKSGKELTPFVRLVNCFLQIIRYPKYLDESEVVEFVKYLYKIKEVVLPYPETTAQAVRAAYRVFDIIKELYTDEERERAEEEGSTESEEELLKKAMGRLTKDMDDATELLEKASSTKLDEAMSRAAGCSVSAPSIGGECAAVRADGGILAEECEGIVEVADNDSFFSKATSDERMYRVSLERVKRYVPAMSRVMKGHCQEYKLIHKSMRSGVLDTGKLVEAIQGVQTVYLREGKVTTDKIAVGVLIDESGSMGGSRIEAARDAAILINEAIGDMANVELYIYGHSGDIRFRGATEINVYRENGYAPKYALGSVSARCENRDGLAILETAKRIRKQTKNPVLMFVLSDGAPAASGYGGASAMMHVKNCVKKAERLGFQIIQVCIHHSYDPSKMFDKYVIFEDMSRLAFELSKQIKKCATELAKVHIT